MSYILDALRRAEAERQRGAVPGLHAQAVAGLPNAAAAAPGAAARRLGLAAAALLLGLALAAAWLLRPAAAPGMPVVVLPAPAPPLTPAAARPPGPAAPPSVAAVLPTPAPVAAAGAWPPALPTASQALPPAQPGRAETPPGTPPSPPLPAAVALQPSSSARRLALAPASIASATLAAEVALAPAQPATATAPARLPRLAELPGAQQRELGPLLVGGAMHAEQAALRIVILNGQVFHEGDKLGPDLQVQQIRLKSVVMSHRGQRFELPF